MKKIILPLFTIAALSVTSCGGSEEHKETAEHGEQTENTGETNDATSDVSGTFNVNPETTIQWQAKHYKDTNYVHKGTIAMTQGNLTVENGKIVGGRFEFDMNSILEPGTDTTKPWTLQGHFKGPDFFDVGTFALADFTINSVDDNIVTGTINIKGVSEQISFPAEISVTDNEVMAKADIELNFLPFNIEHLNENEAAPEAEKMEGANPTALINVDITATKAE